MLIATIDGGTTNTRVFIWRDGVLLAKAGAMVGARDTAVTGSKQKLFAALDELLSKALAQASAREADLNLILVSGMLTSGLGIMEVPHVVAPVTVDELTRHMVHSVLPEWGNREVWFVPGVKNFATEVNRMESKKLLNMDIMRGEETQAVWMLSLNGQHAAKLGCKAVRHSTVLVLPGSHNKYVPVDEDGRIKGCLTTLAGEMWRAINESTILAETVQRDYPQSFCPDAFADGLELGLRGGIGYALFHARILDMFGDNDTEELRNYIMGVLLADDYTALLNSKMLSDLRKSHFVVSGRAVVQEGYAAMLRSMGYVVGTVPQEEQELLAAHGALELARRRGLSG